MWQFLLGHTLRDIQRGRAFFISASLGVGGGAVSPCGLVCISLTMDGLEHSVISLLAFECLPLRGACHFSFCLLGSLVFILSRNSLYILDMSPL